MEKKTNYKASEQEVMATVNDFMILCHFIEEGKTTLSKRMGVLGKNDLFELNKLLNFKKEVAAPNFQQESYPVIDLMFKLALLGKLYVKTADAKGNVYLTATKKKSEFDRLNSFEKYSFLLETFWIEYDFTEYVRFGSGFIHEIVQVIANSIPRQELIKGSFSKNPSYDPLFSCDSVIVHYFSYFGLCTFIPIDSEFKKIKTYDDTIKIVIPTSLGVNICEILTEQEFTKWNIQWSEMRGIYNDEDESDENDPEFVPLFRYFEPAFPEGVLKNTVMDVPIILIKGNYIFKVSLEKNVWRKIKLSSTHSLEDLHSAIQEAYDFDNDHLYSFFMDNKRYSRNAYQSEHSDEGPYAYEAIIGELGLYTGQKILYLFDYGDSWEFSVQLLDINEDGVVSESPEIIEIKGEAPEQYPNYDDFEFGDEE